MNPIIILFIIFVFFGEYGKNKKEKESKRDKSEKPFDDKKNLSTMDEAVDELKDIFKRTYEGFETSLEKDDSMKSLRELLMDKDKGKTKSKIVKERLVVEDRCNQNEERLKEEKRIDRENKLRNLEEKRREKANKKIEDEVKVKQGVGLYNRQDLVKAIVLSEVLGEPKSIKNKKRNM